MLAVPRVDRVPPLRCSQFAAPIWTRATARGGCTRTSGDGSSLHLVAADEAYEITPRRTA
jgi:hypothetical protein